MTASSAAVAPDYRVYRYRWIVMAAFMAVNLCIQVLWISYASITDQAAGYYHVSHLLIGLLAMIFMIVFIPVSLPAAWVIDTLGFRVAVGFGAVLMGICGLARGLAGPNYSGAIAATVGIAIAQPFLMNAWTKVPANWMAPSERATGVALATLSNLVGIALGEALTPPLARSLSVGSVQVMYGALALVTAVAFVVLARERPATPPCPPEMEVRALVMDGLRHALRVRAFLLYLAVWFIGMGIFNGILTWVDDILKPRGFASGVAGTAGALILIGGILGGLSIATLSDRRQKRVRFMMTGILFSVPGLLGFTFARTSWLLYLSSFLFGFFLISVGPIGMQYAAEATHPTPEGTSQGVLQLVGQASVAIVYLMTALKTGRGSYTPSLLLSAGLLLLVALLVTRLHDLTLPKPAAHSPPPDRAPPAPAHSEPDARAAGPKADRRRKEVPMRPVRVALAIIGGLLLVAAGVLRLALLPAVAKLPSDSNTTNTFTGTAKVLLNQAALAPGSTAPLFLYNVPLEIKQTARVLKSNSSAAVVDYRIAETAAGQPLPSLDYRYAVDRKTLGPSKAISAPGLSAATGLTISFPIGTAKHTYPGWVQDILGSTPLHYAGTSSTVPVPGASGVRNHKLGFDAYVFTQAVPTTPLTDPEELATFPSGIPKSMLASLAGALNLPPAEMAALTAVLPRLPATIPLAYTFAASYTDWVAPADGTVLDVQASETRSVGLPASVLGVAVPLTTISQFQYTATEATFLANLRQANKDADGLTLVGTTLPLVGLIVGLLSAVAAVALGVRRHGRGRPQEITPPDARPAGPPAGPTPEPVGASGRRK